MTFSLEELWGEHKRFVIFVGGGLIVLLAGLATASSMESTAKAREQTNRRRARNVEALGADLAGREGFERGVAVALTEQVAPSVRRSVEAGVRPGFRLEGGASPFIFYHEALGRVEAARVGARAAGIEVPDELGLQQQPPEPRVPEQLAVLDLCERLLGRIRDVSIRKVSRFQPAEVEYLPTSSEGPERLVLRRLPVRLTLEGPLESLERFLASFQQSGSVLEVASFKLSKERYDVLSLEVELAALALIGADQVPAGVATRRAAGDEDGRAGLRARRSRRTQR